MPLSLCCRGCSLILSEQRHRYVLKDQFDVPSDDDEVRPQSASEGSTRPSSAADSARPRVCPF